MVWVWTVGDGARVFILSSDWRAGTLVPPELPEPGSQDLCCHITQAVGQEQRPQELLLLWMLLGLRALACLPFPLITQLLGDFYYLFKLLDIYCRLASAWFGGVGGAGNAEKELEACSLGFLRPVLFPCLWNLPGSPACPAGGALSSDLELSVRKTPRPSPGQRHCFPPAWPTFPELVGLFSSHFDSFTA